MRFSLEYPCFLNSAQQLDTRIHPTRRRRPTVSFQFHYDLLASTKPLRYVDPVGVELRGLV